MIEVLQKKKKGKLVLKGYIDNDLQFVSPKKKLRAYIESNKVHFWNKEPVFFLDENNSINDYKRGSLGYIKDLKIYDSNDQLYFQFDTKTGEIMDDKGMVLYQLKGNIEIIDSITFLGFCFAFFDLFC